MCGLRVAVARDVGALALSDPQCSALAPALRSCGVPDAPTARALVTTSCLAPGMVVRLTPAGAAAIPVATIAAAAQHDLDAAPGAQEQSSWTVQLHNQTAPVVLDGIVPARHTAVAPPSSARCRARRGHQAARRERAAAAPTFFGIGRLYRASRQVAPSGASTDDHKPRPPQTSDPSRPRSAAAGLPESTSPASAWPPCRAARQTPLLIDQSLGSQCTAMLPHENSNPRPRHHIVAVPDQRSHTMHPAGNCAHQARNLSRASARLTSTRPAASTA